jgi:hypothetical protein
MYILFEGKSQFDNSEIVVIATNNSKNGKTGDMWQTWIMPRYTEPHKAVKDGSDSSVCGQCPLRPSQYKKSGLSRGCYVKTHFAPLSTWRAYHRGSHEHITPDEFRAVLQGQALRMGSWGDPASVPFELWQSIGVGTGEFNHTGYTHGYLLDNFDPRHLEYCMVSLDPVTQSMDQIPSANAKSRSFRVIRKQDYLASIDNVRSDEVMCPASKESGFKTTCAKCGLCAGAIKQAKNIAIVMH